MLYRIVRRLFLLLAAPLFRFAVEGAEQVPQSGPGIVVAPHRSWLDPACVSGACPRPVRFLILDDVYRKRWGRWFYSAMGAIAVPRGEHGAAAALRSALRVLQRGEMVGVFPEGRIFTHARPGALRPGAALLALRSGAPIIPMGIDGSDRAWPHGRRWPGPAAVRVRIGAPIVPPASGGEVEALLRRVELAFGELRSTP
ncbi:MAG TPA: lysophospholipid acyltransferase family protein [Candidatus Polarisedimenticolaceae bacterium]|nr:lysophospholipid acyltransferase family protein [Candidatus Polarisedimenticolaceae bacterium]